jgi:hypothetical protein
MAHYPMRIVSDSGKVHAAERLVSRDKVVTACAPNLGLVSWSESDDINAQDVTCRICRRVLDRIDRRLS